MNAKINKVVLLAVMLGSVASTSSFAQEEVYYPAESGYAADTMAVGTTGAYILTPGSGWTETYMPDGLQTSHDFTTWEPSYNESTTEFIFLPEVSE